MPELDEARLEACEERLKYRFRDRRHLVRALTHGSAKSGSRPSNERLEFLGDAILGMVVSAFLYGDYPNLDEGRMTKIKAQAVSKASLRRVAAALGLSEFMIVGKMFATRASISRSILADAVEAIIAAVYVDGGFHEAVRFVVTHFKAVVRKAAEAPGRHDFKSQLGQWAQRVHGENPAYRLEKSTGPHHDLTFHVTVSVAGETLAEATGASKKAAEQEAARRALESVGDGD